MDLANKKPKTKILMKKKRLPTRNRLNLLAKSLYDAAFKSAQDDDRLEQTP